MADNLDVTLVYSGRDDGASATATSVAGSLEKIKGASEEAGGVLDRMWSSMSGGLAMAAGFRIFDAIASGIGSAKDAAIGFNQTLDGARAVMSKFFDNAESVNNSMANLNQLAAKTPFAFEGLLIAQQRTIGAAQSADQLKQNMDAIATVAANTGRVSTANMDRISLALGQMKDKGHLAGGEMMQLTEAGVNMGDILAKHFNTTTAQIQDMIEKGKVSSQDVFAAMREYAADPKNREALDKLANTWEGAWSTIEDVSKSTIANVFRPFFDLMTEGAIAVANFLQTEQFQTWAAVVQLAFQSAADGVRALLGFLAPLGEAIATAFGQLTSGDFSGAFNTLLGGFGDIFGQIWTNVQTFIGQMFGAGENVIDEFAGGMLQSAQDALGSAVQFVSDVIGSFLIGNSPPPEGPLSQIDKAGQNLMETYGNGMKAGLDPSKQAVAGLADTIRDVGTQINDLTTQHNDLKNTIDDVKRSYEDQIRPLQDQLDIVKQKGDAAGKEAELQFKIQENNLKQLEFEAKGDPIRRAQIQQQLAVLGQKEKELGLADQIADVERQRQKIADDGQKSQLENLEYERQRAALLKQMHEAEQKNTDKDSKNNVDSSGLASKLKELDLRHQMAQKAREEAEADAQRKLGTLDVKGQELDLQQQLNGLVDKGKLGQIAQDKELLQSAKDQYEIAKSQAEIEKQQQITQLQQQIKDVKLEESDRVRILQDQMTIIDRQKQGLEDQRKSLQGQKAEMSAMLTQAKEAEKTAAAASKNAPTAGAPTGGLHVDLDQSAKEMQERIKATASNLAGSFVDGFKSWLVAHFWQPVKDVLTASQNADVVNAFVANMIVNIATSGQRLTVVLLTWSARFLDWVTPITDQLLTKLSDMIQALYTWIEQNAEPIGNSLLSWSLSFVSWLTDAIPVLLDKAADLGAMLLEWVGDEGLNLAGKLLDWATAFVEWVGPAIPDLLTVLGGLVVRIVEWVATNTGTLLDALGSWALAFVQWVGPKIPPLLIELGKLLVSLTNWAISTALPAIVSKLTEWGAALIGWIGPRIVPLLIELGKLYLAIETWILTEALPAIALQLLKWGAAFLEWVTPLIGKVVVELAKVGAAIIAWIGDQLQPGNANALPAALGKWTAEFLGWCADVAGQIVAKLTPIMSAIITWIVSTALPAIIAEVLKLGIAFGTAIYNGIDDYWQKNLYPWLQGFGGAMLAAFGWTGGALTWAAELLSIGAAFLTGIYNGASTYWTDTLSPWLLQMGTAIMTAFGWAGGALTWVSDVTEAGKAILRALWTGLNAYWTGDGGESLSQWWTNLPAAIMAAFGVSGTTLTWAADMVNAGRAILTGLYNGLDAYWRESLNTWLDQFKTALRNALHVDQASQWLTDTGKAILDGLQSGINNALGGFWEWLQQNLIDKIPEAIRNILHLDHDTGEMAMVGDRMIEEIEIGIRNRWPSLHDLLKNLTGDLHGNELIQGIQLLATGIGGPDFARAAAAISAAETGGGKDLSEIGGTGAKGPFQFDPGGELQNYAKYLHMSVSEAGDYATLNPLDAAKWALEGFLGDAINRGLSRGLSGVDLAVYGEKYGERPYEPDDDPDRPYRAVRDWYDRLYGLEDGAIVRGGRGGILAHIGEGSGDEIVSPLPNGWRAGDGGLKADDIGAAVARHLPASINVYGAGTEDVVSAIRRDTVKSNLLKAARVRR